MVAEDETVSESLFERFNDLSMASSQPAGADRIIRRITITKERVMSDRERVRKLKVRRVERCNEGRSLFGSRSQESLFVGGQERLEPEKPLEDAEGSEEDGTWTLGISIVQGTDNNVYVKELVNGGPGSLAGIGVGDQVLTTVV